MKALGSKTLVLFALLAFAGPVAAQPLECSSTIDNLGELVADLDAILEVRGSGDYGALGGTLDRDSVRAKISGLSDDKRRELAGKLLTIAQDRSLTGECSKDQVRYNAAMVLFELASAERDAAKKQYFIDCLIKATQAEADPAAKRQLALNLDKLTGSMTDAQKAEASKLVDEYLPESPDYPTVFGDKDVVNVVVHAGDETFQHSGYDRVFSGPGTKVTKVNDGLWEIEYKVTPDDPTGRLKPITYKIKLVDEFRGGFSNLDIFNKMDSYDPAVEVYNFHSQYGSGLSKSIREGVDAPESKKIFLLGSCKSKVNGGRIEARYPKIGSIYTRDSEYFVDTPRTLKTMLTELANHSNWNQISRALDHANLWNNDNYFFPNDRRRLQYLDSDLDGIPDAHDTGVNCGLANPPQSNDFGAKTPVADKLSGEKILYAVTAANGVMGYTNLVSNLEDKFVADGFAPADPNGPRFLFTPDGDKVKVKVNAAYSHMSDTAMAGAMLRDFVMYDRTKGGTREASLDDKILAYAMGVKLFDAWSGQGGSQAYSEYQKAYNLGKNFSLWEAASKIDHNSGVTSETISWFKEKLGSG